MARLRKSKKKLRTLETSNYKDTFPTPVRAGVCRQGMQDRNYQETLLKGHGERVIHAFFLLAPLIY